MLQKKGFTGKQHADLDYIKRVTIKFKHELKEKVTHLSRVNCFEFKVLGRNDHSGLDRARVGFFGELKARSRKEVLA